MAEIHCRHFNGYKPCGKSLECKAPQCQSYEPVGRKLIVVGLGAMGAVLRATSILPGLVRKYPGAHITWLTEKHSAPLLYENPLIDRIITLDFESLLKVSGEHFELALVMDKDQRIGGILQQIAPKTVVGFRKDPKGLGIIPANPEAEELWSLGLSDQKKFYENTKPETQLLFEAFALGEFKRDPYVLKLSNYELRESKRRREHWLADHRAIVGINTGCSSLYTNKKLSVPVQRELIVKLQRRFPDVKVALLGGPEDRDRNLEIADGLNVISTPTNQGLRDGLTSMAAVDLVISGDSLGLHMGIALKKWCIAWFGPTCPQEIDLYDHG
ncbi:MAG: glycosyltransferase family 9 protein, partial [Pseudomonadota bacterium]